MVDVAGSEKALTDGDPQTAWNEQRPGVGQGELVVMNAPAEVPIPRLSITVAPPQAPANGAAPRTFYLVTDDTTFAVTMPTDAWLHPGDAYDIPLPEPIRTRTISSAP